MAKPATVIRLSGEEANTLTQYLRAGRTEQRLAQRARVILVASQGQITHQIAEALDTRPARVSKWRQRFAKLRLAGLGDAFRSGRPRRYRRRRRREFLDFMNEIVAAHPGREIQCGAG
jgi:hypothetical protein